MNGKVGMVLGIGAGVAVVGGLLYLAFAPVDISEEQAETRKEKQRAGQITVSKKARKSKFAEEAEVDYKKSEGKAKPVVRMRAPEDWFAKLPSSKDRAIAKKIQDAQDADNREAVFKAAEEALSSKNAEVRQAAVDALSLQGEAAIQPLLNYVGDSNKDVAESAYRAWDDAVDSLDAEVYKMSAVREVLQRVNDEEHVKEAVSKIETFDQERAIRELAKLAQEDGKVSEAAKESYEQVTGEPFESWEAAQLKALVVARENAEAEGDSDDAPATH